MPGCDPWVQKIPWRRKWQPTLVFLPGKYHAQRILAGHSPHSCTESDTHDNVIISHYLYITYLQICLLSKMDLQPQNQYLRCFHDHLQTWIEQQKVWVTNAHTASWGWQGDTHSSQAVNKHPPHALLTAMFFYTSVFLLFWPSNVVLKCHILSLTETKLCCILHAKHIC